MDDPNKGFSKALKAGVQIAMGSDIFGGNHGENAWELEVMVDSGMTPEQALVAATSSAARLLDVADWTGSLIVGKAADIILVDGNPLVDIGILRDQARITLVMRDGVIVKDATRTAEVAV
jgi:imidazolonepropionase-like amidohydrolase